MNYHQCMYSVPNSNMLNLTKKNTSIILFLSHNYLMRKMIHVLDKQ